MGSLSFVLRGVLTLYFFLKVDCVLGMGVNFLFWFVVCLLVVGWWFDFSGAMVGYRIGQVYCEDGGVWVSFGDDALRLRSVLDRGDGGGFRCDDNEDGELVEL